jgi:hypothetical protein
MNLPHGMHLNPAPFALLLLLLIGTAGTAIAQDPFNNEEKPTSPFGSPARVRVPLVLTFESYTLAQQALDTNLLDGATTVSMRDRVRGLVAQNNAELDNVMAVAAVDGERSLVESIDELRYPTEFDPPMWGRNFNLPTAWEMRPTGHRIEVEPSMSADKRRVIVNAAPDFTRLVKFTLLKTDAKATGEVSPIFATRKFATTVSCPLNVPTLLGTCSRPIQTGVEGADGDGRVTLTFATARLTQDIPVKPSAKDALTASKRRMGIAFRFYSMARATARDLLATTVDGDKLHELVRALPPSEYKLEHLMITTAKSGQRATIEETAEYLFGTELEPSGPLYGRNKKLAPPAIVEEGTSPPPGKMPVPGPPSTPTNYNSFEMQPLGWRVELDSFLRQDERFVELAVVPEHSELRGQVKGHPLLAHYPDQPVLGVRRLNASTIAAVGHQCFLGTMNMPHDTGANGRVDDGRVWFAFVMVTVE